MLEMINLLFITKKYVSWLIYVQYMLYLYVRKVLKYVQILKLKQLNSPVLKS